MESTTSTTITISERTRRELLKVAGELQQKRGKRVDYEDVIRHLISEHQKKARLLRKACHPVGVPAEEFRDELRIGRTEDRLEEEELET